MIETHSRIDILANVAGVSDGFVALHEVSDDEWDRVLDINLTAAMRLCRAKPVLHRFFSSRALSALQVGWARAARQQSRRYRRGLQRA